MTLLQKYMYMYVLLTIYADDTCLFTYIDIGLEDKQNC